MPSIGELFVSLGFDVDDAKLKDFNQSIKGTLNTMLELAGVSLSIAGFARLMEGASQTAAQFREMTKEIGLGTEGMQKFALAANQVNPTTSVEQFRANYTKFATALLTEVETYGSGEKSGAIALLTGRGVNRGESPDAVLADIHKNMPNLLKQNPGAQGAAFIADLLDKAGIGRSSRPYFDLTEREIDARTNELLITKETTAHLADLADKAALAAQWLSRLGTDIADWSSTPTGQVLTGVSGIAKGFHEGHGFQTISDNLSIKDFIPDWLQDGADHVAKVLNKPLERIDDVKRYFRQQGWSAQDSRIIMQGLNSESGLDPDIYGHGKEAKSLPGEAYGIGQWHKARQDVFRKLYGRDIHGSSLEQQEAFVNWELTHTHARAALQMMNSTTDKEKFAAFKGNYEVAAGWKEQNNTINVYSTADPKKVAEIVMEKLQHQNLEANANIYQGGH